jgi:hypothetical protein
VELTARPHQESPLDPSPARLDPLVGIPDQLDALNERPLDEHAEVFSRVHAALTAALATTATDSAIPSVERPGGER